MKVVSIVSGGLDSVGMVAMFLEYKPHLLFFDYGQKGIKEREVVEKLSKEYKLNAEYIDIKFMKHLFGESNQLTSEVIKVQSKYDNSVIVPLRNGIFLIIAGAFAYSNGFDLITLGSHLEDIDFIDGEHLYPDCTPEFFKIMELGMHIGTLKDKKSVKIHTPSLIGLTKKGILNCAFEILGDFIFETWSCYRSGNVQCGVCESCRNRKKAFVSAGIKDKTVYFE